MQRLIYKELMITMENAIIEHPTENTLKVNNPATGVRFTITKNTDTQKYNLEIAGLAATSNAELVHQNDLRTMFMFARQRYNEYFSEKRSNIAQRLAYKFLLARKINSR